MPHAHGLQPKILFSVINPLHACKLFVEEPLPSESLEPIYQKSIAIKLQLNDKYTVWSLS